MLWEKACRKGRFAEDMEGEGIEDLSLTYLAHVLIWDCAERSL